MLGNDTLVNREQLGKFIQGGLCFKLHSKTEGSVVNDFNQDQMDNWICEDDLETFWEKNCLLVRPHINTCIDRLSKAKKEQDREALENALKESKNGMDSNSRFDYDYSHLGHLFLGECV